MGLLSLCSLAQRRTETAHLSNGPAVAVGDNRIKNSNQMGSLLLYLLITSMANTPCTKPTVLIPVAVPVSSLVSPHFHQDGKWRPG